MSHSYGAIDAFTTSPGRKRGTSWRVVLATAITVVLVVTGCSSDDDNGPESAPTTDAAADLPGEPIKLMVVNDSSPDLVEGAEAAAAAVNRDGGIGDRPLEVVSCDTEDDPNTAADCGRQAVSEGFVSLVGSLTPLSTEYMPMLAENQIPSVGNLPVNVADFTSPASFPLDGGLATISAGLSDALYQEGDEAIAIARVDLDLASAIQDYANQGLAYHDTEVVGDVTVPQGAPDMAPYVAAVSEADADGVLVGLFGQDATNFLTALRQDQPDTGVGLVTTELTSLIEVLGEVANGMLVVSPLLPPTSDAPAVTEYIEDLEAIGVDNPGDYRINGYAAVKVFASVAENLPEVSSSAMWEALPKVNGLEIGLMPPIQFQDGGVGGLARAFNACSMYLEIEDGELFAAQDDFIDVFTGDVCPL